MARSPDTPPRTPPAPGAADPVAPTALERPAALGDPLERAVARAAAEAALFGDAAPVTLGRYRVIERAGAGGMGVVWSAWDPELGRGVALKLASSGDAAARARALDEGRALARLSHPNVVPIYDVLEHEAGVMLVMELVKGETLRAYAAGKPGVLELVRAYRQAGEGLAAAHAAGLVHRDFKPDNAILAEDGRVRVLDFGLAHADGGGGGEIAGTPRYMAPEQRAGEALTAAVDQYALCVALREAIEAGGAVPRWLGPILTRGAADRAADRYPSMRALLAALADDPRTRLRRRGAVAAAVLGLGGAAVAFVAGRAASGDDAAARCSGGEALVTEAWGARRTAVREHLAALGGSYAADAAPALLAGLDGYASRWTALHRGACEAHHRGEISADLLDRRAGCLSRRRAALATIGELATTVTADGLADLVEAASGLPALDACDDDAALMAAVAPPPRQAAAEASAIADLVARVDVEREAGRFDEARRDAEDAVARAAALGYRPLVARTRLARGRVGMDVDTPDRGAADLAVATREAIAVGDEPLAIEAYARQAWAVATTSDPTRALDGLPLIEAMAERAGERAGFARALLENNRGSVALAQGDRAAARARFDAARAAASGLVGAEAIELTAALSGLLLVIDEPAARDAIAAELIETRTRLLGATHPRTLIARINAGMTLGDDARLLAELGAACEAMRAHHPSQHAIVAECGLELALVAAAHGDVAAAAAWGARVLETAGAALEPEAAAQARAYGALATAPADAVRQFTALADQAAGAGPTWFARLLAGDDALGAAVAAVAAGDTDTARARLSRARQHWDEAAEAPPAARERRARLAARVEAALKGSR